MLLDAVTDFLEILLGAGPGSTHGLGRRDSLAVMINLLLGAAVLALAFAFDDETMIPNLVFVCAVACMVQHHFLLIINARSHRLMIQRQPGDIVQPNMPHERRAARGAVTVIGIARWFALGTGLFAAIFPAEPVESGPLFAALCVLIFAILGVAGQFARLAATLLDALLATHD